MEMKSDSSEKY